MRNTEKNESDDIEMMNILKQCIFLTKNLEMENTMFADYFFAGPPQPHIVSPNPKHVNPLQS